MDLEEKVNLMFMSVAVIVLSYCFPFSSKSDESAYVFGHHTASVFLNWLPHELVFGYINSQARTLFQGKAVMTEESNAQ